MSAFDDIRATLAVMGADMKAALAGGGPSIAQVRNTDVTTNINAVTWTDLPANGISEGLDSVYAMGANGVICNFNGRVKVTAHVSYFSAVARVSVAVGIAVDGVLQPVIGKSGYLRATNGHNNSSASVSRYVLVSVGDEVTIQTMQDAQAGAATMDDGGCQLMLERY